MTLLLLALVGCPGPKDSGEPCVTTLTLSDANNYAFAGTLDIPSFETVEARDIEICWDEMVEDLQCHALDPLTDVANVGLVRFGTLGQDEVEVGLAQNDLQQADMTGYVEARPDGSTCVSLDDMSFFGTPLDVASEYTDAGGTYLLIVSETTTPGVGARMLAFLDPSATSDVTHVDLPSGCGMLDFTVELDALEPVGACATGASWPVDWGGISMDGQGNEIADNAIDGVLLGFYEGWATADLEANILDLELSATRLYTVPVTEGHTADLAQATDGTDTFAGFEGDGAWVLALTCSRCYNPAPPFVTILTPEAP